MDGKEFEREVEKYFSAGSLLLAPFKVKQILSHPQSEKIEVNERGADFSVSASASEQSQVFRFIVECKASNTPQAVQMGWQQAQRYTEKNDWPLLIVPYLSDERLDYLESQQASGVDMCGNGIIIIPDQVFIRRSGQPNLYRASRPLQNPFKGRSALAARMILARAQWESVGELRAALATAGAQLSASQVSKVIKALQEDLILTRRGSQLVISDPFRLLDKLGKEWEQPRFRRSQLLRLRSSNAIAELVSDTNLNWAIMGESSVGRYATFSQGGPRRIAVSDLATAWHQLDSVTEPESVRNFADLELCETDELGFYFDNEVDKNGVRFASRLQTWLELQCGDARQQEAARDLRQRILGELS